MEAIQETGIQKQSFLVSRSALLTGAGIAVLCTLFFFSLYWNRFAGLRSGNGSYEGGIAFLDGLRPYRDYFTAAPPLNLLLSAGVLSLFGKKLEVIRGYGVCERLFIAIVLYFWLVRLFRTSTATIATVVTMVVSAGDPSDTLSSYNFATILLAMLSGFAATFYIERDRRGWPALLLALLSGIFAACSFSTKQTIGLGVTVAVPCLVAVCSWQQSGVRKAILFLSTYLLGWALAIGALLLWLWKLGILNAFFVDVFFKGPSAKGSSPFDFVIRTAKVTLHAHFFHFLTGCVLLTLLIPAFFRTFKAHRVDANPKTFIALLALLSAAAIAAGAFLSYGAHSFLPGLPDYSIFYGFYGAGLLGLLIFLRSIKKTLSEREGQLLLLAGVSFSVAFMLSLSWPALEGMLCPALGLVIAASIDGLQRRRLEWVIYAVCAAMLVSETDDRLNRPQGFHEWVDAPVREAHFKSSLPQLAGMRLPLPVVKFLDGTVAIVSEHSTATDTIFCYPEFGLIYPLAQRHWPTQTASHNIDVVNDEFARSEAKRLLEKSPAVLIYYRVPEIDLRGDEHAWRNGKRSGQRDLIAAMETLITQYHLAGTYVVPPNSMPVMVYVRN